MKLLGGNWSKGDLIAVIGCIAAILAIPGVMEWFRDFVRHEKPGQREFENAVSHMRGWADPTSDNKGIELLRQSAGAGYARAQYLLGIIAEQQSDEAENNDALKWIRESANQGFAPALEELGWISNPFSGQQSTTWIASLTRAAQ